MPISSSLTMTSFSTLAARSFWPFGVSSGGVYLAELPQPAFSYSSSEVEEDMVRFGVMWFACGGR
jgi:hypothetical protein